jgi:hypothetical protein
VAKTIGFARLNFPCLNKIADGTTKTPRRSSIQGKRKKYGKDLERSKSIAKRIEAARRDAQMSINPRT